MPKVKLASQRLNTGGAQSGLNPVVMPNGAGRIAASAVNSNAGNVAFTRVPRHEVAINTTLSAAAQAAQTFEQSAFRYYDREAQAKADTKLIDFDGKIQMVLAEYKDQLGQAGAEGYNSFQSKIKSLTGSVLQEEDPYVRSKMVIQASEIQNKALSHGSMHKAQQFRVWQGEILQAKEQRTLAGIFDVSGNPEAFDGAVGEQLNAIATQYKGRDDYIQIKQAEFTEKAFTNVIETHTRLGNFAVAGNYITKAKSAGVDPVKLAQATSFWQNQLEQKNNQRMTSAFNAERAYDLAQKHAYRRVMNYFTDNAHRLDAGRMVEIASEIDDPDLRRHAEAAIPDILSGRPITDDDRYHLEQNINTYMESPEAIFTDNPGMNKKLLTETYSKVVALRENGLGEQAKKINKWAEMIVPSSPFSGILGNIQEAERKPLINAINQSFFNHMEKVKKDGGDPVMETLKWQTSILNSDWLKSSPLVKIPRTSLVPVTAGDGSSMDILHLDSRLSEAGSPTWVETVTTEYNNSLMQLADGYDIFAGIETMSPQAIEKAKADFIDSPQYQQYRRELYNLEMQKLYFLNASAPKENK